MKNLMEFSNPSNIKFGNGAFANCLSSLKNSGNKKILVIADSFFENSKEIKELTAMDSKILYIKPGEPEMCYVQPLIEEARALSPETIVAIGGGSAIDTAKIIRALVPEKKSISDLLNWNFSGTGKMELFAVPTTAGTGSEVTKFAIVNVEGIKETLIDNSLIPTMAFIDPEFLENVPAKVMAFSAVDAMAHNIESFMSKIANPVSKRIAYWGAELSISNIRNFNTDSTSFENLAAAATLGGLSINHGSVCEGHMLGHMLGSNLHIPHGQSVGLVLPAVIDYNLEESIELREPMTSLLGLNKTEWKECGTEVFKMLESVGIYEKFDLGDLDWNSELLKGNWFNGSEYVCRIEATEKKRLDLFHIFESYLAMSRN